MSIDFSTLLTDADVIETRKAGESIVEMGAHGDVMYILKSGRAQIKIGEFVFETAETGSILGEMAIFDDGVRSASVFAVTDCEIAPITKARLLELVRQDPSIAIEMLKVTTSRLRATNYLAHNDSLTSLPNRVHFQERCRLAISRAERSGTIVGVLFIDLDDFKSINESLGYACGDEVLQEVSRRFRNQLHELDIVARLGADEFAVLLEDIADVHEIINTAQTLMSALSKPILIAGQRLYVSASVGISCYPQDGAEATTLLKNADTAMYQVKKQQRNSYHFFSASMNALAVEALNLKTRLREALEREEFSVYYQPRISIASGRITGIEALIRWQHPELGFVPPAKFIPVAEQTGLIDAIGDWVLTTACAQHKTWLSFGMPLPPIAVNLSLRQFRRLDLGDRIEATLKRVGLDPRYLELEVTESVMMQDPARTIMVLERLRSTGITIALDDFGTGYSSLGYIRQFPLDCMKIDQSFISGVPGDLNDVAITKTVITLAQSLNLRVIAEGIENREQIAFLRQCGCDEIQGYLFSEAIPANDMGLLLKENFRNPWDMSASLIRP